MLSCKDDRRDKQVCYTSKMRQRYKSALIIGIIAGNLLKSIYAWNVDLKPFVSSLSTQLTTGPKQNIMKT